MSVISEIRTQSTNITPRTKRKESSMFVDVQVCALQRRMSNSVWREKMKNEKGENKMNWWTFTWRYNDDHCVDVDCQWSELKASLSLKTIDGLGLPSSSFDIRWEIVEIEMWSIRLIRFTCHARRRHRWSFHSNRLSWSRKQSFIRMESSFDWKENFNEHLDCWCLFKDVILFDLK